MCSYFRHFGRNERTRATTTFEKLLLHSLLRPELHGCPILPRGTSMLEDVFKRLVDGTGSWHGSQEK